MKNVVKEFFNLKTCIENFDIFFQSRPVANYKQKHLSKTTLLCFLLIQLTPCNLLTTWRFVLWPFIDSPIIFCHPLFLSILNQVLRKLDKDYHSYCINSQNTIFLRNSYFKWFAYSTFHIQGYTQLIGF